MRNIILTVFFLICSCIFTPKMYSQDFIPITDFSDEELAKGEPIGWKTHKGICREIKNRIMPRIVEMDGRKTLYVNASDNGAILFKPVRLNPKEYPLLCWNWKISNTIPASREKEEGGDDYPAAVCVVYGKTFFSIPYSYRILIYVYGNNLPVGERFENPCEAKARMIVVQSGAQDAGKWLSYKVNHFQDYIQEFGEEPPKIIYVGIQTNADRTHGKVEGWYSDICLNK
ncbi:MAG TPA: DUF3047 domain-containing protein [Candidatus Wunengus sp. YC60]|uniref:DUF3047 domain-containing protein n=1 Tax=Candidatus Wunengus sp. YC60 TaxID=3367697 RepID=UPI004028A650